LTKFSVHYDKIKSQRNKNGVLPYYIKNTKGF
jgi:hypothetical protein